MKNTARTIGTTLLGNSFLGTTLVAGLLLASGCQSDSVVYNDVNNSFAPDPAPRDVDHINDAQTGAGARADATLQPAHFNGNALNSLGRTKLNLMLKDDEAVGSQHTPIVVYVNVPAEDPTFGPRKDAISGYLNAAGIAMADIKVEAGHNPGAWNGSQPGLIRLPKTESPEIGGGTVGATVSVAGDGK